MTNLPALLYKADDHAGGMHLSHRGEDATIIADKLSVLAKLAQVKASGFVSVSYTHLTLPTKA